MLSSTPRFIRYAPTLSSALLVALAACGGSSGKSSELPKFDAGTPSSTDAGQSPPHADAAPDTSTTHDAGTPEPTADTGGAAPRNSSCTPTNAAGKAITPSHGRLDGTLVYVIGVGQDRQCNGDDSHVHLQIQMSGSVYDVAVDIGSSSGDEVGIDQESLAIPDGAWSEGWHNGDDLAYPSLGVHSSSFAMATPSAIASQLESALANTSQISVFCMGYSDGTGCHDVHYKNGSNEDGALVLSPTAATSPILFFKFTSDSF